MAFRQPLYRLKVGQGFLAEASEDVHLKRWRSAVDNSQLATENAAKAVLALVVPVGKTHNPAPQLREALSRGHFPKPLAEKVELLAECAEKLGFDVHIQTDYGDETGGLTPWDLFGEEDAHQALSQAREAVGLAEDIIREIREVQNE